MLSEEEIADPEYGQLKPERVHRASTRASQLCLVIPFPNAKIVDRGVSTTHRVSPFWTYGDWA